MAYTEHTAFPLFLNIPDDSRCVHEAMHRFGIHLRVRRPDYGADASHVDDGSILEKHSGTV